MSLRPPRLFECSRSITARHRGEFSEVHHPLRDELLGLKEDLYRQSVQDLQED